MADPKLDELYRRIVGSGAVDPMAHMREIMAAGVVKVAAGGGDGAGPEPVPVSPAGDPAAIMNAALQAAPFNMVKGPGQINSQSQAPRVLPLEGNMTPSWPAATGTPGLGQIQGWPGSPVVQIPGALPESLHPADLTQLVLDPIAFESSGVWAKPAALGRILWLKSGRQRATQTIRHIRHTLPPGTAGPVMPDEMIEENCEGLHDWGIQTPVLPVVKSVDEMWWGHTPPRHREEIDDYAALKKTYEKEAPPLNRAIREEIENTMSEKLKDACGYQCGSSARMCVPTGLAMVDMEGVKFSSVSKGSEQPTGSIKPGAFAGKESYIGGWASYHVPVTVDCTCFKVGPDLPPFNDGSEVGK